MNSCDRCESKEGVLECSQCAAIGEAPVYYCEECSAVVHIGRTLSRHEVKPLKSQFQTQAEDAEKNLEVYQRSIESLRMRKKELENALDNVLEQQRIFERALRESVFRAQEKIMNHAKEYRNAAKEKIAEKDKELQSCIADCEAKINEASQIEQDVREELRNASAENSCQLVDSARSKLDSDKLTMNTDGLKSLYVCLPVVDYSEVIDAINNMSAKEGSAVEKEMNNSRTLPPPVKEDFKTLVTVSTKLTNKGTFWVVPQSDELTSLRLSTMNLDIRKKYITDPTYKTYAEMQSTPKEDELVFFRYKMDRKWYRGIIEKVHDKMCEVRFIDYGTTHTTSYDNILPCVDEMFSGIPPQAVNCCLFDKELEETLQNDAKWHFTDITGDWVIDTHFKHEVEVEGTKVWYIDLTYVDENSGAAVSIRDEIEKKNHKGSAVRDGVISCTDIRLQDNPNLFNNKKSVNSEQHSIGPSTSNDAGLVGAEKIVDDSEEKSEEKWMDLPAPIVDSNLMASTETGWGKSDIGMSQWSTGQDADFSDYVPTTNDGLTGDADFGHFFNVDAPTFELNESTGFSPGATNESADSPSLAQSRCPQLEQFAAAMKDLTSPTDAGSDSRPRTPRPILGKAQPQEEGGKGIEVSAEKVILPQHHVFLQLNTSKIASEDPAIVKSSTESIRKYSAVNPLVDVRQGHHGTMGSSSHNTQYIPFSSFVEYMDGTGDANEVIIRDESKTSEMVDDNRVGEAQMEFEALLNVPGEKEATEQHKVSASGEVTATGCDATMKTLDISSTEQIKSPDLSANATDGSGKFGSGQFTVLEDDAGKAGNVESSALWEGMELECEVISELEENGSFYVRIIGKDSKEKRIAFQKQLNDMGIVCPPISDGKDFGLVEKRGDFCRVQCQGQPDDKGRCMVLFIDEGTVSRVTVDQIKEVPDKYFERPGQARLVSIAKDSFKHFGDTTRKIFKSMANNKRNKFTMKVTTVNQLVCYVDLSVVQNTKSGDVEPYDVLQKIRSEVSRQCSPPLINQSVQMVFSQANQISPFKLVTIPSRGNAQSLPCILSRTLDGSFPYTSKNLNIYGQSISAPVSPSGSSIVGVDRLHFGGTNLIYQHPGRLSPNSSDLRLVGPRPVLPAFSMALGVPDPTLPHPQARTLPLGQPSPASSALQHQLGNQIRVSPGVNYSYQLDDPRKTGDKSHMPQKCIPMPPAAATHPNLTSQSADSILHTALSRPHGVNVYGSTLREQHPGWRSGGSHIPNVSIPSNEVGRVKDSPSRCHGEEVKSQGRETYDSRDSLSASDATTRESVTESDDKQKDTGDDKTKSTEPLGQAEAIQNASENEMKQELPADKESYAKTAARLPINTGGLAQVVRSHLMGRSDFGRHKQTSTRETQLSGKGAKPVNKEMTASGGVEHVTRRNSNLCYNCWKPGHWRNECTEPRKLHENPERKRGNRDLFENRFSRVGRPKRELSDSTEQQRKHREHQRQGSRRNSQSSVHTEEEW